MPYSVNIRSALPKQESDSDHRCTFVPVMDEILTTKEKTMSEIKHNHQAQDGTGNMLLTASILFANIDYSGLADYAIKAFVGGAIWMAFKVGGEYLSNKIKKK